jgi:hypothetical protein
MGGHGAAPRSTAGRGLGRPWEAAASRAGPRGDGRPAPRRTSDREGWSAECGRRVGAGICSHFWKSAVGVNYHIEVLEAIIPVSRSSVAS